MKKTILKSEVKITIIYWIFGIVWIYLTDFLLEKIVQETTLLTRIQNVKGWFFVTASALLIYSLFRYYAKSSDRADRDLRENEEKFRLVFESANVGKSITNPEGKLSVNKAFADMLGYTREEMELKTWQMLTPEEEIEPIQAIQQALLNGEQDTARMTKRYIHKNGSYVWADVSVAVRRDEHGKPLHFITTIVDITSQKKTEEALKHSHDLMHYIIEHNRSAIAVHDKDLKYIYVSQRYLEDYHIKEKDIIGKHHYVVFPDLPQKWRDVHQRALTGEVISAENDPYYREDGSVEWTRWECRPWYAADNTIGGIIVYTEVITQRMKIEQALRESEERLRLAVNGAQQGIYDINLLNGQQIVNDIYSKMLGYNPETFEITLEGWMNRLHPDDYDFVTQYLKDYLAGKIDEYKVEFRMGTAIGDYIWVLSLGSIVQRDENGKPLRMLGTHTDITERKKAEREKTLFSHILAESLNEIFVFNDLDYKFVQVNKAATINLGYSSQELLNMSPSDIAPEITKEKLKALVNPLRTGEEQQIILETTHKRKDGSTYDVEVHLQLQRMEHESLFTAIILDISDRNRAQKEIYDERQRLANIIEGTNVATWEWNVQTGESVFNEHWAEMLGYTMDELKPISIKTWERLINPEDLTRAQEMLQNHFSGTIDYYDIEFRMKHKHGHWIWVQDRGRVSEWTQEGKPLIMLGSHHDITQRKESEQKIMQQLEELRRWHAITLGREERIIELKQEINQLLIDSSKTPKYESVTKPDV